MSTPGKIVQLGTAMTSRGKLEMVAVREAHERTDTPRRAMSPEEIQSMIDGAVMGGTPGGLLLMRILSMPAHEKAQVLNHAASDDPLILWFALLPKHVRAEFVNAALHDLKERAVT